MTAERTVEEDLARAAGGDHNAFALIVRRHQAMVFSIAFRFLRDRSQAEDLAQDVFLRLYQHLGSIKSELHLTFWLRQAASRRCIDLARRRGSRRHMGLDEVPDVPTAAPCTDPLLAGLLRGALTALPDKPRMVVILRYQEDLEPSEIAELLGMPVATVKSHLRRSLAVLREEVGRRLGEGSGYERF